MSRLPLLPRMQKTVYYETTEENNSIDTTVRIVQKPGVLEEHYAHPGKRDKLPRPQRLQSYSRDERFFLERPLKRPMIQPRNSTPPPARNHFSVWLLASPSFSC